MSFPELFELVELLDITRPPDPLLSPFLERKESGEQPGADTGESLLEGVQQDIKRVCLKDYGEMSVLVLYCRNGHLFYRLTQRDRPTKLRIVRYHYPIYLYTHCVYSKGSPTSNIRSPYCLENVANNTSYYSRRFTVPFHFKSILF